MDVEGGASQPLNMGVDDSVTEARPRRKRTHSLESNVLSITDFTEVIGKKPKHANLKLQSSKLLENSQSASQTRRKTTKPQPSPLATEDYDDQLCVFCAETGYSNNTIKCEYCEEFYHLVCCIPEAKKDTYSDLLQLTQFLGWSFRACRAGLHPL